MARSTRQIAAIGVLLCWGIALGWLALRHLGQSDQARLATQAALRISPTDAWFRIMAGGVQVGYAGITLDTLSQNSYRIREQASWDIPVTTALPARSIHSTEYTLGASVGLDSLQTQHSRSGHNWGFAAVARDNGWRVTLGGTNGWLEVPPPARTPAAAPVPLRAVPLRMSLVGALGARDRRTLPVVSGWPPAGWFTTVVPDGDSTVIFADSAEVDPASGRWEAVAFDTAETVALLINSPESPLRMVVDSRGTMVSVEYLFGVRWEREDFDIARTRIRERVDTARLPIVTWGRPASNGGAGSTRYAVTRRSGAPVNSRLLEYLTGGRQIAGHGRIIVLADTARTSNQQQFATDPLIQSDDSAVAALSSRLSDRIEASDFTAVVRAIRSVVTIDTTMDWPEDAAGVLRQGRARREGAARLLAAVLLSAGWDAGIAIGVEPAGDTLRTHAWVEARRRGRSPVVSIDPLTGDLMPGTWLRVASAGSAAPEDLFPVIADVRFTLSPRSDDSGEMP